MNTYFMLDIRILYFQDCPNFVKACKVVTKVIEKSRIPASFTLEPVLTDTDLETMSMDCSPTLQLNGVDVDLCYYKNEQEVFKELGCRLYDCDHGAGCPSEELLLFALENVAQVS
jgi:hypothetical protein